MILLNSEIIWDCDAERNPENLITAIVRRLQQAKRGRHNALESGNVNDPDFLTWLAILIAENVGISVTPAELRTMTVEQLETVYRYLS